MSASGTYCTQVDCERRITRRRLLDLFDDDGDGSLEAGGSEANEEMALQESILDAESEVEQLIRKTYGTAGLTWLREQGTDCPRAVKRMVLDIWEVRAYKRHPEYQRAQWIEREKRVEADLEKLRVRELELDTVGSPEPAVNEGGEVYSGDPDDTDPKAKFFLDDMGAF
jgi:hypothetical protein